jgi:hypothetical protein
MWLILWFGFPAIVVSVMHALGTARWSLIAGGALLSLTLILGMLGTVLGRSKVAEVLPMVDPSQRLALEEAGYREAWVPLQFGVGIALLGGIALGVGLGRTAEATPPPPKAPPA